MKNEQHEKKKVEIQERHREINKEFVCLSGFELTLQRQEKKLKL